MDRAGETGQTAQSWPRAVVWGAVLALLAGLLWRSVRYFMQFPIWGDEGLILVDVLDCDYHGLTQTLPIFQVAPLLFLWAERAVLDFVGSSELAVRLPSFIAGTGGLVLFAVMARRRLAPVHGALAIAILAVSYWPVRHSCEAKPYALDLLASAGLMLGALGSLADPRRTGWLIFLAAWAPLALLASYPAAFVAGGMSLALLVPAWRSGWKARGLYALLNLLMLAAFAGHYLGVARNQIDVPQRSEEREFMQDYWRGAFPPAAPAEVPLWLLRAHAGGLFAYPVGGPDWGGSASFALAVLGVGYLWARGQRMVLAVCVLPFALTLFAAVLHKYPYGGSPRVAQHLAPMACVLIAAGGACLLQGLRAVESRGRWACAVCLALAALGLVGATRDVRRPYKTAFDCFVRAYIADFRARVAPGETVIICNRLGEVVIGANWYLRHDQPNLPWARNAGPAPSATGVWLIHFSLQPPRPEDVVAQLGEAGRGWSVVESHQDHFPPEFPGEDAVYCTQVRLMVAP
jgi:hypothetical protein